MAEALPFWLFCGIGSSAIAFTLQMVAQKYLHPVTATLLMSLESVFAVVGGWLFLQEQLTVKELIGCGVIFFAILLAQIPFSLNKAEKA
jgi:drug/metabolite transporter (DMT)-like permease